LNESAKIRGERRLEVESRFMPYVGGQRRQRSKSEGEASQSQARMEGGADDRNEQMMEQKKEQQAVYVGDAAMRRLPQSGGTI
jgi:hypothetical protein